MQTPFGKLIAIAILGVAATLATTSKAEAFTLAISPQFGSTENTGAKALLNFDFVQTGANTTLNLGIRNTTNGSTGLGATQATLVGIGFDLPDNISGFNYSALSSAFTQLYNGAVLNPYGTFDVGIRASGSGNFAGGNPQSGLTAGQSTLAQFTFANSTATTLESLFQQGFSNNSLRAVGRFQQVNAGGGSDKVLAGFEVPEVPVVPETSAATPEPTTLAGMGLAGLIMGWQRRRQIRQLAQ